MVVLSQNGFLALTSPPSGTLDKWITGRVLPGDVAVVFDYFCTRFNAEVERINKAWSWGWAPRPIRDSTVTYNHASATAIDLNAPVHPLGRWNTFTPKQKAKLKQILADLEGVIRGGFEYKNRPD